MDDLYTCSTSEANTTTKYFNHASLAGKEKLHNLLNDAWRIVFRTKSGLGAPVNHWGNAAGSDKIGSSQWIRNARIYFMISDKATSVSEEYILRTSNTDDASGNWGPPFITWLKYSKSGAATWHGGTPNHAGVKTSHQKLGATTGWHSMSLKSALRLLMRNFENTDFLNNFGAIGFSLEADDEDDAVGNLLRVPDHDETDSPYMIIAYGQPTLSRTRGFGKRMMARL